MDPIFLLTTLDQNYLPQLQVLLTSISVNNPKDTFVLSLLHSGIPEEAMEGVRRQCGAYGYSFLPIRVDDTLFQGPLSPGSIPGRCTTGYWRPTCCLNC